MNVKLLVVGKTQEQYLKTGVSIYEKRLKHYVNFEIQVIPELKNAKNLSENELKKREGKLILKKLETFDTAVLLDERGSHFSSVQFSNFLRKKMNSGIKNLVFVIGGAYGFSDEVQEAVREKMSLSKMTFSHQMVRLFFVEQLYRAMTILKRERYHH
ncbi:MAG: 23S rRNA (pseudouridine(1915)-N(3))-methyltransferase RlmH [Flavobacteriales bacterium]|nr:MAG: 23S rRNA (pseudouridine(1915)-N(3))-methyltransferase RlmH [Flavobacteriales bacterium]